MTAAPARLALTLALNASIGAAAAATLGRPDLPRATAFARGDYPTLASAGAAATVLLWGAVAVGALWSILSALRPVASAVVAQRRRISQAGVVLALGVALLAAGLARHGTPAVPVCCGAMQNAERLLAP